MFIFDEIARAVESVGMFVEEKVNTLRGSSIWGSSDDIVTEGDVEEDDFDRYLRDCARSVLFLCGVPESIRKEQEEEKRRVEKAAKLKEKETLVKNFKIEGAEPLFTENTKGIFEVLKKLDDLELSDEERKQVLDSLKGKSLNIDIGKLLGLDSVTAAEQET